MSYKIYYQARLRLGYIAALTFLNLVGRVGLEPTTKGFKLARVSTLFGLSHHPRREHTRALGCRALAECLSDRLLTL